MQNSYCHKEMNNNTDNTLYSDASILDALKALECSAEFNYTLFIINRENRTMVGTLTDGDIRRYLVRGGGLADKVLSAMNRQFLFLSQEYSSMLYEIQRFRNKGVNILPVLDKQKHILNVFNLKHYKSILPVDAVLMAGGKGERLRPLTEKTPKPLIKIGDKCIIDYNIDSLLSYGLNHISVTVNYLREQLEEHFSVPRDGVKIATVREPKYLGTIGSIKFVETFYNDTILVMNSDLFTNINYEDFFLHFQQNDADMSVAAVPYVVKVPYGVFNLEGRNIKGVTEKPTISYYANAGIYLIKKERLELIPENEFFNATDFMDLLIKEGYKVIRYPISGYWIDIGQHDELERAREIAKHIGNL